MRPAGPRQIDHPAPPSDDLPGAGPLSPLSEWLRGTPGRQVLELELRAASDLVSNLFGYELILVGGAEYEPLLDARRTQRAHRVSLVPSASGQYPVVRAEATHLPLLSDSVDVVVLPHVLEYSSHPHDALRECERVLIGEGHLLLIAFNPWGMMGLWRHCLRWWGAGPWSGQFFGVTRLKDWLALLGFDVLSIDARFFRPPFRNERVLERLGFLEALGGYLWPYLGGTHVILAKKRVSSLTPIRPRWRRPRRLVSVGIAEPAPRLGSRRSAGPAERD